MTEIRNNTKQHRDFSYGTTLISITFPPVYSMCIKNNRTCITGPNAH